ncbi:enoyl-CoA hydratase/isomerase family protein [Actinokineospora inagensis]|uniref:enoyl-CoA hydratase/isomerase family protein n=1 Tax=Actinokineospora inagensis TaxID=103730 RepID=UPI0004267D26|nr:enoyl-CoA hydratase-related protein [Actinokineospora inagensis]
MSEHLLLETDGPVATMTIDRPAKKNAISYEMWAAIPGIAARVQADPDVRVLLVTGSAGTFSAGADISEFASLRADADGARRYNEVLEAATKAFAGLDKPTIAAVEGFCIGGGCELALACDLRIAAADARFGVTPAKLGIVFNLPSTKLLVDTVGPAWAKQILFTGDILDAETAQRIGLVNELHGDPVKRALELAATMASRSQVTIRGAKDIVGRIVDGRHEEDDEVHFMYSASVNSPDYAEGVAAFLEKRTPRF